MMTLELIIARDEGANHLVSGKGNYGKCECNDRPGYSGRIRDKRVGKEENKGERIFRTMF